MPELTAILAAEKYRAALLSKERAAATRLVNAYGMAYQRLNVRMDALTAELDALMAKGELSTWSAGNLDTVAAKLEAGRKRIIAVDQMASLRRQITDEMGRYAALVESEALDVGAREAIAQGIKAGEDVTRAALPGVEALDARIMANWQRLDGRAVESMLGFLSEDSPLRIGLREQFAASVADQVEAGLIESIALGYNPRKLAATFVKELGQSLTWSLRTARTVQLNAYREATRASYVANADVVKGWEWRCSRKSNTCMSCIAMDGTKHKPDERLNDHHNGHCVALPITITYKDLGLNVPDAPDPDTWLKSLPEKRQMEMLGSRYPQWKSGEVRYSESGQDWFKRQPETVQREMMGKGKYEGWQEGIFDIGRMSKETDDPVWGTMRVETTLAELGQLEGDSA